MRTSDNTKEIYRAVEDLTAIRSRSRSDIELLLLKLNSILDLANYNLQFPELHDFEVMCIVSIIFQRWITPIFHFDITVEQDKDTILKQVIRKLPGDTCVENC